LTPYHSLVKKFAVFKKKHNFLIKIIFLPHAKPAVRRLAKTAVQRLANFVKIPLHSVMSAAYTSSPRGMLFIARHLHRGGAWGGTLSSLRPIVSTRMRNQPFFAKLSLPLHIGAGGWHICGFLSNFSPAMRFLRSNIRCRLVQQLRLQYIPAILSAKSAVSANPYFHYQQENNTQALRSVAFC